MRFPSWLGFLGVGVMILFTLVCAVLTFGVTRQTVIDVSSRGVQISSPVELARVAFGGADNTAFNASTNCDFNCFMLAQPTATAQPTLALPTRTPPPGVTFTPEPTTAVTQPEATIDPMAEYIWEDPRQITILLMGIDQRTGFDTETTYRTDTMMVVNINPVRQTIGVLSIPRDLWVDIPGSRPGRINTANAVGDTNGFPGGGPALAAATVQENLGIPIDRYILVNFDVFLTVVDTVAPDGVEVEITEVIDDPDYPDAGYGIIPIHFDPGVQRLDAEKLLQYARTRATQGGDFDRARRQQQVILALQQEVLSAGGVANFISQAPTLYDELSDSYKTNLTLEELLKLGNLVQDIPRENIHFGVIDNLHVQLATTNTGDQVLIPDFNSIRFLIQQVFNPLDDLSLADLKARADAENATIVVYNDTEVSGLAGLTRDWLVGEGVNISNVGNIPEITNRQQTIIRDYTGKIWTARYLAELMDLPPERVQRGGDGLTAEDIMVVVGEDIQPLLSGE
jgi:polyisoprenyl-teichoic acid--peptidoglycan teichoic acid transferase